MDMTHAHTQTQVQRSFGSKDRVATNGPTDGRTDRQTDATDCFTFPANALGNNNADFSRYRDHTAIFMVI